MTRARRSQRVTTDEQALVATVFDRPHDDLPRLVYADWLEENGDPDRAELIRVQCELAALDADWADAPAGLRDRERLALAYRQADWPASEGGTFDRGFPRPSRVQSEASKFGKRGDDWRAPLWDYALSWRAEDGLARILACPTSPRVGWLSLNAWSGLRPDEVDALLTGQDRLGNVSDLDLPGVAYGTDPGRLVAGLRLPHLRSLRLPYQPDPAAAVRALDGSEVAPRLRRLDLGGLTCDGAVGEALAACQRLTGLRSFAFGHGEPTPELLLASDLFAGVRDLDFGRVSVRDDLITALAADPASARLRRLALRAGRLTAAGYAALAASPHLDNLRELYLMSEYYGFDPPGGARAVVDRFRGRLQPSGFWGHQ